jgi:hypothetical protein
MGRNAREMVSRRSGVSRAVYRELRERGIMGETDEE